MARKRVRQVGGDTCAALLGWSTTTVADLAITDSEPFDSMVAAAAKAHADAKIARAAAAQAEGIHQVPKGTAQLDQVTQKNAPTAEECSANGVTLEGAAQNLDDRVLALGTIFGVAASSRSGATREHHHDPIAADPATKS